MTAALDALLDEVFDYGEMGFSEAAAALGAAKSRVDDPMAEFILAEGAELLRTQGPDGLRLLRSHIDALFDGHGRLDPVAIRQVKLHKRAPLLRAQRQREVDQRKRADAALTALGRSLGKLAVGIVQGVVKRG